MLREFGPSLWVAEGPTVSFLTIPYPTRMAVARLSDGSAWVWSPVELTPELAAAVDAVGPVRHLVEPNKLHHLFLDGWVGRHPEARLYAPPGLAAKRPDLHFHAELGDCPDPSWGGEIEPVVVRGSFAMTEVVFLHRPSRTALVCDLVQRHDPEWTWGWRRWLMRLDGLVGEAGSTPREWRASFWRRRAARAARDRILAAKPERLLIAHGACADADATAILARALAWMG